MKTVTTYVGIDEHKKDLFMAMLVGDQPAPVTWTAPNEPKAVRRLVKKLENLALRQQLAVYRRTRPKPAIRWSDRLSWIGLRWAWPDWKSALVVVRPGTVIAWHRRAVAWYWTRRSRPRGGRPQVGTDVRCLIREMAIANPLWGAPRIHGELLKVGFEVSERRISRLMPRRRKPPAQSGAHSSRTTSARPSRSTASRSPRSPAGSCLSSSSSPTTGAASCRAT